MIVGIGASAGGTPAIKRIFSKIKDVEEVSFVFTQHLDEGGKEIAIDALSKICKQKVVLVSDKLPVERGCYYAVPPHTTISIENGQFKTKPAKTLDQKLAVVDHMLLSLGEHYGPCAVGVILSGESSDGALGIKALNEADGLTIIQDPKSAEHRAMPDAAIATAAVDHILEPEEIGIEITNYAKYLRDLGGRGDQAALKNQISTAINSICDILQKHTHHDFKHYKTSTLLRRIQRRMQVLQLNNVEDYIQLLTDKKEEVETLFTELLINVTSFFRDREAFEALRDEVLKKLIEKNTGSEKIRIWVPGCSTGQEPYTIAILLRELLGGAEKPPEVQIIATDIDDTALNIARKGAYPITIAEEVPPKLLSKYFTKRGGQYHVNKELREMCLFSIHNLINDPPFSQLDLISCRNLLIYLGSHLQKKLFPVFHYALKKNGYLFLGTSESLTTHKELFKTVHSKHRIAQRKASAIKLPAGGMASSVQSYLNHFQVNSKSPEIDLNLIGQRIALDELAAKYVIVNDDGQVVTVSGGINKYMEFGEGSFQNNLVKLVKPSLRTALRTLFNQAKKEMRKASSEDCTLKVGDRVERVGLIVQPMPQLGEDSGLFWVAFQYMGLVKAKEASEIRFTGDNDGELVEQLEHELSVVRQELDKSVQDLEASNEELKSSNEELLSMNEELQSANEELESSKEEVQNANEALQRSNTDLENLLASTEIATLFLDDDLQIQNFTPTLSGIYNVSRIDIGRSILDITSKAEKLIALPKLRDVIRKGVIEDDINFIDGRRLLRRVTPYRTTEGAYSGIVVTFIDVTHVRVAEELRRESENKFQVMADTAPVFVWISNLDRKRTWFNKGWLEFTGQKMEEALNEGWQNVVHPADLQRYIDVYNANFERQTPFHIEYRLRHVSGEYRWISARGVPRSNGEGHFEGYIGACLDIHEQRVAREELKITQERFQTLTEVIPQLVWTCLSDGRCDYLSRQWEEYTGIPADAQMGFNWIDRVIHPDDRDRTYKHWIGAVQGLHAYDIEYRIRRHDGEYRWFQTRGTPIRDATDKITRWFGTCTDIHELKVAQERVASNEKRLEMMIRTSPSFMCLLTGPDFVFEQVNEHYKKLIGFREVLGKPVLEALPEVRGQGFIELLEKVRESGEPFIGNEVPILLQPKPGAPAEKKYLDFVYQPSEIIDGKTQGIFVHGVDVTNKVEARLLIETERENFRNLFKQTPEMVCILNGPEHVFEFVNHAHIRVLGFDATGKAVREAQPESVEVHGILDEVYTTGKTAELHEIAVTVGDRLRYFNLTYAAKRNHNKQIDGVMILGTEVTDQVLNRESTRLQKEAFQHALNGDPLERVLELLAKMVEFQLGGSLFASVLVADKDGKRLLHGAAPGLPHWYNEAVHGIAIGPNVGSCGTAAHTKSLVVVDDIMSDPRWSNYKELAERAGLAACWSMPILTAQGKLLGTFALYSKTARMPTSRELEAADLAGRTTALILERQSEILERIETDAQLKFALSSARMGTWDVTLDTQEVHLSEGAREIFGSDPDYNSTDLAIDDFIHPDDREGARRVLANALSSDELYQDEYRIVLPNGEIRWAHVRGRAHYLDGKPDRLTGIVLDITAQKQSELELKKAKLDAEKAQAAAEMANESKTQFLANMSHEIRTPLAAIIGFAEILREELPPDETISDYLERVTRNADHLRRLIDELLDLSKIEADRLEIHEALVEVDSLLADVYSTVGFKAEHKGVSVHFGWRTRKPKAIVTDQMRLAQILNNVIGNAVKFTDRGSVDVEFCIDAQDLVVRVKDTGIGLTEEQQKKLFTPFVQADSSITRKFGGTGLGLALSKKLANRLGGDLELESSEPGVGTTFTARIRVREVVFSENESTPSETSIEMGTRKDSSLRGRKVLVVDDVQDNRTLVAMYLRPLGILISEASNGIECLEMVAKEPFDLVLMDIQMPLMDGRQAMVKLKESNFRAPVVALTAHALKEERDKCMQIGFNDYLTKPIAKKVLLDCLHSILG